MPPHVWLEKFSYNLTRMMIDARISQKELAELSGISIGTISKLVRGLQVPTIRALLNISYALRCTVDELVDFGEPIR